MKAPIRLVLVVALGATNRSAPIAQLAGK